jgi:acetyltransferase-like isoleucine patch superfamily enzyme
MIRAGIHPSAIIDFQGALDLPASTVIEPHVVFFGGTEARLTLGERNIFYPGCVVRIEKGYLVTGDEVSFGPGCHIYEPRAGLEIGNHCMIGGGTLISGVEHGYARRDIPMRHQTPESKPVRIEDDVWIGMGVKLLPGVTIGKGAIIGAGSVVTRSIPAYSIAIGAPCRVVRER